MPLCAQKLEKKSNCHDEWSRGRETLECRGHSINDTRSGAAWDSARSVGKDWIGVEELIERSPPVYSHLRQDISGAASNRVPLNAPPQASRGDLLGFRSRHSTKVTFESGSSKEREAFLRALVGYLPEAPG